MDQVFVALRVLLSLAAVVGLLWVLQRRITRGARASRTAKLVTVVTRQGISQKASVVVIDVEGKRFLLGVTEHSVTVLNSSEILADVAEEAPVQASVAATERASVSATVSTTARASAAVFGAVMALTASPSPRDAPSAALQQFDARTGLIRPAGALDGSIFSPATWKRAVTALRQSR